MTLPDELPFYSSKTLLSLEHTLVGGSYSAGRILAAYSLGEQA